MIVSPFLDRVKRKILISHLKSYSKKIGKRLENTLKELMLFQAESDILMQVYRRKEKK